VFVFFFFLLTFLHTKGQKTRLSTNKKESVCLKKDVACTFTVSLSLSLFLRARVCVYIFMRVCVYLLSILYCLFLRVCVCVCVFDISFFSKSGVVENIAFLISRREDAETETGVARDFFLERTAVSVARRGLSDETKAAARATRSVRFATVREISRTRFDSHALAIKGQAASDRSADDFLRI